MTPSRGNAAGATQRNGELAVVMLAPGCLQPLSEKYRRQYQYRWRAAHAAVMARQPWHRGNRVRPHLRMSRNNGCGKQQRQHLAAS